MANIGTLNRIIKLQRILLPLNAHHSTFACSSHASAVLLQHHRERVQSLRMRSTQRRHWFGRLPAYSTTSSPSTSNVTNAATTTITTTTASTAGTAASIDEFRAREERREEEFARQQAEEEKSRKSDEDADEKVRRAKVEAVRAKVLEAALVHVPTLGWTRKAIVQGAEDVGLPSVVHGMFPEGGFALVSYFYGKCNDELIKRLQEQTDNGTKTVNDPLNFLVQAVRARLEMIVPYKGQWAQALALIAMPQNAPTALAQVLTLVDDICYYSGDRSVDFGWYTRRIGLATILKMTELYMLQDSSANHVKTWEFLTNRMDEAVQLQMMLSQTEGLTSGFQRSFNSAFITARNILGLGYNRR